MKYYADSHEWIEIENDKGKVGISAHAQKELGEIVYVELPQVGHTVKAGEEIVVLESTKAAADLYSPVSGTITAINETLKTDPSSLNTSPEGEGYLFEITLSNPKELEALHTEEAYAFLVTPK